MRILGIDPGSSVTGYGIVERDGAHVRHVAHGALRPPRGTSLALRLDYLYAALRDLIALHAPAVVAVERIFVAANPRSALVLAHARGVALSAVGAAGLPIVEYSASQVKQAVTGSGSAAKPQVQAMVWRILALDRAPLDATDALAIAIRHAHGNRLEAAGVVGARSRRRPQRGPLVRVRRLR